MQLPQQVKTDPNQAAKDKEMMEFMGSPFPSELIDCGVMDAVPRLLQTRTPDMVKCNWETFKRLLTKSDNLTITDMGIAINVVTGTPMIEFYKPSTYRIGEGGFTGGIIGADEYVLIQDAAIAMAAEWNKLVSATRKRIDEKYANIAKILA